MTLRILNGDLISCPSDDAGGLAAACVVIKGNAGKVCIAFAESAHAGLVLVLRGPVKRSPKANKPEFSLSTCTWDPETLNLQFLTHAPLPEGSAVHCHGGSNYAVVTDYKAALSHVFEWLPDSKTMRRVWNGKGWSPGFIHGRLLLLRYKESRLDLVDVTNPGAPAAATASARARTMVQAILVAQPLDVFFVVYEDTTVSLFGADDDGLHRFRDLGRVFEGAPSRALGLQEGCALLLPPAGGAAAAEVVFKKATGGRSRFTVEVSMTPVPAGLEAPVAEASAPATKKEKDGKSKKTKPEDDPQVTKSSESEPKSGASPAVEARSNDEDEPAAGGVPTALVAAIVTVTAVLAAAAVFVELKLIRRK